MDTSTFAQKIKAKYPAYQNVDDATLVNKFIEKYPVYKSQVNVQSETSQDISQTGSAITNTVNQGVDKYAEIQARKDAGIQGGLRTKLQQLGVGAGTASGVIGDVLTGAVKTVLPQSAETAVKNAAQAVVTPIVQSQPVQSILSKYEELKQTNPKLAQDISSALGFAQLGLDVSGIGETAGVAKTGVKKGVQLAETGVKDIAQAGSDLVQSGAKLAGDVLPNKQGMISGQISKALDLTQGDVSNIKLLTGNDVGDFIARNNIIGANKKETLDLVKQVTDNQYKAVRDEIAKVTTLYKPSQMPRLKESLNLLENQVKGVPGMESTYKEVKSLLKKKDYLLGDAQRVKELLDNQFSLYSAIGDVKEGTIKKGLANVRKDVKQFIEKEVKNATGADIGTLNNDVSTGKSILKLAEKRSTRDLTRANVSLSDLGTFGTGSVLGTPLGGAAALFVKRVIETPTFRLKLAKLLNSLSSTEKTVIKNELLKGEVPEILKKEVTQSLKPSASNIKKINNTSIPTVSKKNGIMSSDLSTGGNNVAYHGTQAKQIVGTPNATDGSMGKAFYVTDNKGKAEVFGKERKVLNDTIINNKGKKVKQYVREPNYYKTSNVFDINLDGLNIKEFKDSTEFFKYISNSSKKEIPDWFKLSGYDGAYIKDSGTYAIYSPEKIKMPKANKK